MAYNKKNKLKIVFFVREYYRMCERRGITIKRIHKDITTLYPMSYSTMDSYLSMPRIMKQIQEANILDECQKFSKNAIKFLNHINQTNEKFN